VYNFIRVPEGTALLDLLRAKQELPSIGRKSPICASCLKPFNASREIAGHLRVALVELFIPVIFIYPLCRACAKQLEQGGKKEDAVLAAVEKFINGEVPQ
jgi:hypothetical protein